MMFAGYPPCRCAMLSKETLHLTWWPLARDCSYYALSLAVLALCFLTLTP